MANLERENSPDGGRVRVLIVDDSALMRRLLSDLLGSSAEIEVVGVARDGREAVAQAARLRPDVITLDVEMPEVSGLEALPALLAVHEAPVVMVSALTQEGAEVTLQALELGAVELPAQAAAEPAQRDAGQPRPAGRQGAGGGAEPGAPPAPRRRRRQGAGSPRAGPRGSKASAWAGSDGAALRRRPPCVVIGISTGGPQALSQVFPLLAAPLPPILVVQHMLAEFTGVFAERLDRYTGPSIKVKQAEEGDAVLPDRILIAPGGRHLSLAGRPPRVRVAISDDREVSGHRPSIDVLFRSAAAAFESAVVGILMTGMGRDGVEGCKAILAAGGFTIGQDEASSVVYGMNKAAFIEGAIKAQFALDELPGILQDVAGFRAGIESVGAAD